MSELLLVGGGEMSKQQPIWTNYATPGPQIRKQPKYKLGAICMAPNFCKLCVAIVRTKFDIILVLRKDLFLSV